MKLGLKGRVNGFGFAAAILLLATVGVVGYIGWVIFDKEVPVSTTTIESNLPDTGNSQQEISSFVSDEDLDSEFESIEAIEMDQYFDTSGLEEDISQI